VTLYKICSGVQPLLLTTMFVYKHMFLFSLLRFPDFRHEVAEKDRLFGKA